MKLRRSFAGFMAVFVLCLSVIVPVRQAYAFLPVAVLAAPQIVTAGGSYAVAALAGVIGVVGLYLEISDSENNQVRIPLSPAVPVPAPSAPATASSTEVPAVDYWFSSLAPGNYGSEGECLSAVSTQAISNCIGWGNPPDVCSSNYPPSYFTGSCFGHVGAPVSTCPSGYTLSGGSCVLSNARQAVPDKKCDLTFSPSSSGSRYMSYDDADCPNGAAIDHSKAVPGLRQDGDVVWVYGTVDGKPALLQILIQRDSSGVETEKLITYRWVVGENVQTQQVTLSPDGQVTNYSSSLAPGTITAPTSSPSTGSGPGTAVDTPTVTTDPTKPAVTQFPDDYARQPTLQQEVTNTGKIADALTTQATGVVDPTLPGQSEFGDQFFKTTFTNLLGWRLPSHSSQCPTSSFQALGQTFVVNAHCQLATDHMSALQNAMAVVFVIGALFVVLRA